MLAVNVRRIHNVSCNYRKFSIVLTRNSLKSDQYFSNFAVIFISIPTPRVKRYSLFLKTIMIFRFVVNMNMKKMFSKGLMAKL